MSRSKRPVKTVRNTAPCCGDGWWICMCHTKKPKLEMRKAPTVAEFAEDVDAMTADAWADGELDVCQHFEESYRCATCIAELDAQIEAGAVAEREREMDEVKL